MVNSNHPQLKPAPAPLSTLSMPQRRLRHPDLEALSFDVYQTSHMYLACHLTSEETDSSRQWPYRCFVVGSERYYSNDFEETGWNHVGENPIVPFQNLSLHPAACALHYGASAFEGTKAFISAKGKIALFRPEMNARRFQKSAARLLMPKVPVEMFLESVRETVLANREFIPPYRADDWAWESRNPRCLYVRPFIVGHAAQIGVRAALDHFYLVYTTPVRALYPVEGIRILVSTSAHRSAPGGIGHTKASANYIGGFYITELAKRGYDWVDGKSVKVSEQPFHDVLYLDAVRNQYVEEFSGANFIAVTKDGALITPDSDTVLPGITRDSIIALAGELGIPVECRPLGIGELMGGDIVEAFCTGNAAVITPIVSIYYDGQSRSLQANKTGVTKRLWDMLTGIQLQTREDRFGWVREIG